MTTATSVILALIFAALLYESLRILKYAKRAIQAGKEARPVERVVPEAPKHVLVIGDSTSLGTGASDQRNSLVGRLAADFPNLAITNASENAMDLRRLYEKLESFNESNFDIIMIHIGGIDTISFSRFSKLSELLKKTLERACAMSNEKVFVISMNNVGSAPLFRFPLNIIYDRRSRMLTSLFHELCNDVQVIHIPLYEKKKHDPLPKDPGKLYAHDNIHPSDEGYGYWYDKIKKGVIPYLT